MVDLLKRTWVIGLGAALAVLGSVACGGGSTAPAETATVAGTATLEATSSAVVTATAAPSPPPSVPAEPLPESVQSVLTSVAAARNLAAPPALRARAVTQAEVTDILRDGLTDDDRRWFAQTTTLYRLLGYLEPDETYLEIYEGFASGAVIGLYDPTDDTLYVVTRGGRGFDELSAGELETLAHELVHALQDYHFPLDVTSKATQDDLDRSLAWISAVEGDAVTHEGVARRRGLMPAGRFYALGDFSRVPTLSTPAPIERELRFPYTTGANWIAGIKAAGGTAAIDDLLADPPATTAVVLHPERGPRWEPDRPAAVDLVPVLGNGWTRESGGSFGEFHWGNFLQTRLRGLDAAAAAATWRGDRYDVYVRGDDSATVFLVNAGPGLEAGLRTLLADGAEDAAEQGTTLTATLRDGRQFILAPTADGFSLTIGSSAAVAAEVAKALGRA